MSTTTKQYRGRRMAVRLRAVRRRLSTLRRRTRRAATLALATASLAIGASTPGLAQMGQTAMAPAGGIVGSAVGGFRNLNESGPGILYYGINAADRGLGYRGSYMTLGGFVPSMEDDLGGLWAADLRGHLSEYGGFFSNVGMVRKQFIGGTLLGVGVYWDYDGDQNQYEDVTIPSAGTSYVFPGGQTYNQVGISGEWLTDLGNFRSNGYIPVGSTGQIAGPFLGNSILCVNGVNAALGGTDLEVGAYIPGLADWAGMISVGGYAYGNTRYQFENGQVAVPWFGGVYTRLDMTFVENWDFSLQANNDSYFDWTGFARLTYRMGGSRRRNVSDQVEQPMMRNEHIVRAHQVPVVAINPVTGAAWQVYHVDNTAAPGGAGTAEAPFSSLLEADGAATTAYDVVYVHRGTSSASNPYVTPLGGFGFNADNQYLVGEGTTLALPTTSCGDRTFFTGSGQGAHPVIANLGGTAIVVDRAGSTVSNLSIVNSALGISDGAGMAAPGMATIQNVTIDGKNAGGPQGVSIANSTGRFQFEQVQLTNLGRGLIATADGGDIAVSDSKFTTIAKNAILISGVDGRAVVTNTPFEDVGVALKAAGTGSQVQLTNSTIRTTAEDAIVASGTGASITVDTVTINAAGGSAIVASGTNASVFADRLDANDAGESAVLVSGDGALASLQRTTIRDPGGDGIVVSGDGAKMYLYADSRVQNAAGSGVSVAGENATVLVQDSVITGSEEGGVVVAYEALNTSTSTQVTLLRSQILSSGIYGVYAGRVDGPNQVVQIFGTRISGAGLAGVVAERANIDIDRDPTSPGGRASSIQNTSVFGIQALFGSRVEVEDTTIARVATGIDASSVDGILSLRAFNNTITTSTGPGISLSADAAVAPLARVQGWLLRNQITSAGADDINLVTVNPPDAPAPLPQVIWITDAANAAGLGAINRGASVEETPAADPAADPPQPSLIRWRSAELPLPPPNRPVPTPPSS